MQIGDFAVPVPSPLRARRAIALDGQMRLHTSVRSQILRQIFLYSLRQQDQSTRGNFLGRHDDGVAMAAGQPGIARESDQPVTHRGIAHDLAESVFLRAVFAGAIGDHTPSYSAGDVVAPEFLD